MKAYLYIATSLLVMVFLPVRETGWFFGGDSFSIGFPASIYTSEYRPGFMWSTGNIETHFYIQSLFFNLAVLSIVLIGLLYLFKKYSWSDLLTKKPYSFISVSLPCISIVYFVLVMSSLPVLLLVDLPGGLIAILFSYILEFLYPRYEEYIEYGKLVSFFSMIVWPFIIYQIYLRIYLSKAKNNLSSSK